MDETTSDRFHANGLVMKLKFYFMAHWRHTAQSAGPAWLMACACACGGCSCVCKFNKLRRAFYNVREQLYFLFRILYLYLFAWLMPFVFGYSYVRVLHFDLAVVCVCVIRIFDRIFYFMLEHILFDIFVGRYF